MDMAYITFQNSFNSEEMTHSFAYVGQSEHSQGYLLWEHTFIEKLTKVLKCMFSVA